MTLTDAPKTWQQKLSARNVAQMPWDPKPEPAPQAQVQHSQMTTSNIPQSYAPTQGQPQMPNGARIKNEPQPDLNYAPGNYMPQPMNPELAQQRAASLLQQQYGSQATASLGAMQQRGIALPGQQQVKPGLQLPGQQAQQSQQAANIQDQYAQQLKQQQQAQQSRIKTETDGASDEVQPAKRQRLVYDQASSDGLAEWHQRRREQALKRPGYDFGHEVDGEAAEDRAQGKAHATN